MSTDCKDMGWTSPLMPADCLGIAGLRQEAFDWRMCICLTQSKLAIAKHASPAEHRAHRSQALQ